MKHRQAVVRTDYQEFTRWWKAHGWDAIPKELLPPTGFVATDDDGTMLAAGWLYCDANVPMGIMEWIVANPDNTPITSYKAINLVLEQVAWLADEIGLKAIYSSVQNEGLERLYNKHGFKSTDKQMTSVMRTA